MQILEDITDYIHDCWFDAESIGPVSENGVLSIRFFSSNPKSQDREDDCHHGMLRIDNVIKLRTIDSENIKYYDVNEMLWDKSVGKIVVATNIPFVFEVWVSALEVRWIP